MYDYEAKFLKALWYKPEEDPLLTPEEYGDIYYKPPMACIKIDIEGQPLLIGESMLNQGVQVDGDVLFVYDPPSMPENKGFIDSFETPDDFDAETRDHHLIVRMTRNEVHKAREALNDLRENRPSNNPKPEL